MSTRLKKNYLCLTLEREHSCLTEIKQNNSPECVGTLHFFLKHTSFCVISGSIRSCLGESCGCRDTLVQLSFLEQLRAYSPKLSSRTWITRTWVTKIGISSYVCALKGRETTPCWAKSPDSVNQRIKPDFHLAVLLIWGIWKLPVKFYRANLKPHN